MVQSSQTMDLEARFSHILQPIRDLTRNWDLDIAHYLEEYLEDLENVAVTFNHGQTTMNFAEAAMLIQSSACVYSKKVEYLYSLVYQVLDMIMNKKKQQKPSSVDADGNDADAEFPEEDKEEFLLLDDTRVAKPDKLQNHDDPEKESFVHPQTPMNLIAQEEGEKQNSEINNMKGEFLGNMADFQMNCSSMQQQGGVFLDRNRLPFLDSHLRLLACSTPYPQHTKPQLDKTDDGANIAAEVPANMDMPSADVTVGDDVDHGFEPMDNMPDPEQPQEEVVLRRSEREQKKVQFAVQKPKPVIDHWAMSDLYSDGKLPEKALKVGKTFKLPPGVEQAGTKKRKRKTEPKKALTPICEFVQTHVYSHRPKFPKNPCLVPSFPEFDDMFWKEFKRRQELKRRRQKQLAQQGIVEETEGNEEEEDQNWPALAGDAGGEDDNDAADNFEPLQLQLEDNLFGPVEAYGGEFINSIGSSGSVASTYEELVRRHLENFLSSAAKYAQISELSKRVAEWEEKITPRLQEEEQREPFDIHAYGTIVIDGLQKGQCVPFRRIVTGKPLFQICRLFLATLQLANVYNVELSCPGDLEEGMDKLEVRLLSKKRHYEELAEYQAPSIATQ